MSLSLAGDRVKEWARDSVREGESPFGAVPEKRAMTTPEMTIMSSYATIWHGQICYPCCD